MRLPFTPGCLFVLYSLAGYAPAEIRDLTGWNLKSIGNNIVRLNFSTGDIREGNKIRRYLDAADRRGDGAFVRSIDKLMESVAGPPLRSGR